MEREPLPVHLVMAGGASLGAFHGGALAALLTGLAVPARRGVVRLDAVGGTSAGAIAALLAAHAWLEGIDPVWLMHTAWVERLSTDVLRSRRAAAPLSFERLRDRIDEILDPRDGEGNPAHRVAPATTALVLHANLLNLHGLTYDLPAEGDARGTTYDDWSQHVLQPEGGTGQLRRPEGCAPLDAVLASASNPAAFPPLALDRSGDAETYRANGISSLPGSGILWYSDGGPLTNEPVGRVVAAGAAVRDTTPEQMLAVVLDPRSEGPTDDAFTGTDREPTWLGALSRTMALLPAQSVSDDLRRIGAANRRLAMVEAVVGAIGQDLDAAALERLRRAVVDARGDHQGSGAPTDADLRAILETVAGVDDKRPLICDLISPRLQGEGPAGRYLSGDVLGDFGGFLREDLRRNDFALGWICAERWFEDRGVELLGDTALADDAVDAVRQARPEDLAVDEDLASAGATLALSTGSALRVARLLASAGLAQLRRRLPGR